MKLSVLRLPCVLLGLGLMAPVAGQEGHPLKGSWIGEWHSNDVHGESVLLVMDWDGKAVSGIINPGTDNIDISEAFLDPEHWTVKIEAEAETEGEPVNYVIEGRIENLSLPSRSIVGNWRHQDGGGEFELVRQ